MRNVANTPLTPNQPDVPDSLLSCLVPDLTGFVDSARLNYTPYYTALR